VTRILDDFEQITADAQLVPRASAGIDSPLPQRPSAHQDGFALPTFVMPELPPPR